ncbi:MAG: glucose-6-phosphate isomerase [Tidjanibacter sp.]|nr:glucose-6-phosphate isomerase [Tidjanibacter sp.]
MVKLDIKQTAVGVSAESVAALATSAHQANKLLHTGKGAGNDFLGWVALPSSITSDELKAIKSTAARLASKAEVVVVIGIGGSYLGAKAVLDAMSSSFHFLAKKRTSPYVLFAGDNLSETYTAELMEALKEYSIAAIVISKSGTTTEPAVAFRLLRAEIERRYGREGARERIAAVTDAKRGALKTLATAEGYDSFVIPDNVGGRYSVLTPVGLLPLAVAGIDIEALVEGARAMEHATAPDVPFEQNPAEQYAATRNALYRKGYKIEILASYEPRLQYVAEWWKQLYGESEGKEHKGIFPASVTLTADLHSMGQYIQEGERTLFETVVSVAEPEGKVFIEADNENLDGLNFLAGKRLDEVNKMAELGVVLAHVDGGVPNIRIEIPSISEYNIGSLLYFFEKACGISGYILGVNPFNQPGVEAYKKNMFALLDKPGYEEASRAIKVRINSDK